MVDPALDGVAHDPRQHVRRDGFGLTGPRRPVAERAVVADLLDLRFKAKVA